VESSTSADADGTSGQSPFAGDEIIVRMASRSAAAEEGRNTAILIGMIVGFVPTNTMAAGHILEVLLQKPEAWKAAQEAALAGDDDLLKRCLFEALRFKPINPGPFRTCRADTGYTIAGGTARSAKIPKGAKVLASTFAAMSDPLRIREPRQFDPARPASDYLHFGHGMHWCVGAYIAQTHITQTFKALLRQKNVAPVHKGGRLERRGTFPDHLYMQFDKVRP
jgi:cytochrome P450